MWHVKDGSWHHSNHSNPSKAGAFIPFLQSHPGRHGSGASLSRNVDPLISFLLNGSLGVEEGVEFGGWNGSGWSGEEGWWVEDAFVEGSPLWWLLVLGYCIVFSVGVIGNAVLLAALCGSGSRARALPVRNHLMVNLAAADLLVTAVCVPISACAAASHACWPSFLVAWMCELGPLLQRTPVAASTLSLALLSLDRWAALRHPRFAQRFRDKRFVLMSMGVIWVLASLVSAPTFWAREWDSAPQQLPVAYSAHPTPTLHMEDGRNLSLSSWSYLNGSAAPSSPSSTPWRAWSWTGTCREQWTNAGIQLAYAATYLGTAFVSPALIVAACHASVSQKLTAQLQVLSGAAGGGDKTRPRPKQVIIVAREPTTQVPAPAQIPNGSGQHGGGQEVGVNGKGPPTLAPPPENQGKLGRKVIPCDPNSDEDDVFLRMQIQADLESFRQLSQLQQNQNAHTNKGRRGLMVRQHPPADPYGDGDEEEGADAGISRNGDGGKHALKAARRETSIIRAHRRLRNKLSTRAPPPLLPTYSSQSFRSRRRAANLLAALAAVFVLCWAPYVLCALWDLFAKDKSIVRLVIPFALFLGHAHSAINPVVSWRLNRSAFVRFQRQPFRSLLPDWSLLSWCRACTCPCCCCCCCCCPGLGCGNCDPSLSPSTPRRPHVKYPGERGRSNYGRGGGGRRLCCNCCYTCSAFTRQHRRSSSPEAWNRNSSTNEAALGAFHPKYLARLPAPDPISKCHTSHFLR